MPTIARRPPVASPRTIAAGAFPRFFELDMIRGMALFVMLSDHLLGNPWAVLTSRPLGSFSGADLFVLASGIAAGLKYKGVYATGGMANVWSGVARSWVIVLVTCSILRMWSHLSGILYPYVVFWGLVVVLAPVCARGWWKAALALSCLGWLTAFVLPLPAPFNRWVFNPLSWQILFSLGFIFGHRKASGAEAMRRNRLLLLAVPIAVGCFLLRHSPVDTSGWLFNGSPCVGPLRLLDFLGVSYVCFHLIRVPERLAKPFASLGRHGLWVFVWVSVLIAGWEFCKLPSGPIFLRMGVATAVLSSLWLVVPMVKAVKDLVVRTRNRLARVAPGEPAEAAA